MSTEAYDAQWPVDLRGASLPGLIRELSALDVGSRFTIMLLDQEIGYRVDQIVIVEPTDPAVNDQIKVISCTPLAGPDHRLVVRGGVMRAGVTVEDASFPWWSLMFAGDGAADGTHVDDAVRGVDLIQTVLTGAEETEGNVVPMRRRKGLFGRADDERGRQAAAAAAVAAAERAAAERAAAQRAEAEAKARREAAECAAAERAAAEAEAQRLAAERAMAERAAAQTEARRRAMAAEAAAMAAEEAKQAAAAAIEAARAAEAAATVQAAAAAEAVARLVTQVNDLSTSFDVDDDTVDFGFSYPASTAAGSAFEALSSRAGRHQA